MAAFTTMALSLAIAGQGIQSYSQWKAGSAEKRAGEAARRASESEAQLAEYNAAVADLQGSDAIARGQEEEGRFRQRVATTIGEQRAGVAAAGVDVGFGSAVDIQADAQMLGELDALTIRTNAGREAWGYQVQAEDLRRRAEVARREGVNLEAEGRSRQTAARIGAVGSAAMGAGSLLEARYGFGRRTSKATT